MSANFYAPTAQDATEHLEIQVSTTHLGQILTALGYAGEDLECGVIGGELPATTLLDLIDATDAARAGRVLTYLGMLRELAEAARAHGSEVAWG